AYAERDRQRLEHLQSRNIPAILNSLSDLQKAFRRQWLRRNKPSGMEVVQIRLAAQQTRFAETATRLGELLDGKIDRIDELDLRRNDLEIHT
ncbi:MAG: beta-N-acetylhexosaminidase, partial [Kiritimatiellia bacterium]